MSTTFKIQNGDVVVDGAPVLVTGVNKFDQDVRCMLATGSPSPIGTGLDEIVGSTEFDVRSEITQRVRNAVSAMRTLQAQHHLSIRPLNERMSSITRVLVEQSTPVSYRFRVDFLTADGLQRGVSGQF